MLSVPEAGTPEQNTSLIKSTGKAQYFFCNRCSLLSVCNLAEISVGRHIVIQLTTK